MAKILVTGSAGFIGSKVKNKLISLGHVVFDYDIASGQDLLDLKELEDAVSSVDVVYHIAAEADLGKMTKLNGAWNGVIKNVYATHNVAYLCAKYNKWLIYASTVCVYGNQKNHPETEDYTLPNPSDLYACSKYAGEWIVKGYGQNFGMPWTILRFATIYGPGMRRALGLHIFFRQAMAGDPITVHGDGEQDRTLTYIDDLVEGIVAPLTHKKKAKGQIFNLSNQISISANVMAESVKALTESASEIVHVKQRDNQTLHEDIDSDKAWNLLDWQTKTSWDKGIALTYEWMKNEIQQS